MRILVLNCGSSSLKFELIAFGPLPGALASRVAQGTISGIGRRARVRATLPHRAEAVRRDDVPIPDHAAAARQAIELLGESGVQPVDAVAHRIVHGGPRLWAPTIIDDAVAREIARAGELAPLHNDAALQTIAAARERFGASIPMIAVFDTAFFHDLPAPAARYAIPPETADRYAIRRYGFHGLAHRFMTERCAALLARRPDGLRLITLQLGNGCSAAAVRHGKPVDTSMGFTPLEGLVMGTRSGDIDPSVLRFLCDHAGMTPAESDDWLNHRCGLLGVSGTTADMSELLRLESAGDARAALAIELFCHRLRKYIGAYLAVLGGADAIVFGGGIGEHAPDIRRRACQGMQWCGLAVDDSKNRAGVGAEGEITAFGLSTIRTFVIPVDEELLIAQDAAACLLHR